MTALLLAPVTLRAEELELGVRSHILWTENATGVSEDEAADALEDDSGSEKVDEFSLRVTPSVGVRDPDGDLTWSLRYGPSYERYLDESELSGFDQAVLAGASWRFADRWSVSIQEAYYLNQSTVRFNETVDPGEEVTLGFRDQEVRNSRTSGSLTYAVGPRDSLVLSAGYDLYQFPDTSRSDRSTPSTALAYDHNFSERTTGGLRFGWTRQSNQGDFEGDNETSFYNLSGTLEHSFSPTFRIEAAAGPTLIDSEPLPNTFEIPQFPVVNVFGVVPFAFDATLCELDGVAGRVAFGAFLEDCSPILITRDDFLILSEAPDVEVPSIDEGGNAFDTEVSGTDLTFFARLVLVKDWEYWNGRLGYQRSNSESARLGSSSIADTVFGNLTWDPAPFWSVGLSASISMAQQASDQGIPVGFQLTNVPPPAGVTSVAQVAQISGVILADTDAEYWTQAVSLRVTRRITEGSSVYLAANWFSQRQEIGSPVDDTTRWENLTLTFGVSWDLRPIRF